MDHAPNFGRVCQLDRFVQFGEAHAPQHFPMLFGPADHAFHECNFEFFCHGFFSLLQFVHTLATARGNLFAAL